MRRTRRRPADAGARKWKLIALACFGALAVTVAVPQATAHDTNNLAHAVEHVLEELGVLQGKADAIGAKTSAIKNKTDNLPSSPSGTSDTGTIFTDRSGSVRLRDLRSRAGTGTSRGRWAGSFWPTSPRTAPSCSRWATARTTPRACS